MMRKFIFMAVSVLLLDSPAGCGADLANSLTAESGEAALCWMEGDNKIVIAEALGEGVYEFTIHAGKNFIVLEGGMFTGTLALNVSQNRSKGD